MGIVMKKVKTMLPILYLTCNPEKYKQQSGISNDNIALRNK